MLRICIEKKEGNPYMGALCILGSYPITFVFLDFYIPF